MKSEGIIHQLSVEYTPQQNGVAERKNRTLVEMARCLMLQGNLPQSLWAEAINSATYLRNRSATKVLQGKTPFEAWTGRKPYVGYLKTIGAKTLDKAHKRGKFQPKGERYTLVGYSEESKAYRLWKRGTKTIIKARDVKFFERLDRDETPEEDVFVIPETKSDTIAVPTQNSSEEEDSDSKEFRNENVGEEHRGPGRPKLVKTGKRGRPKKVYQSKDKTADPETVSEALSGDDSEA